MPGIGLLQLAVTWYKIRHAGEQAYYYSRTGTAKQCYFILSNLNFLCFGCPSAGIIISLLSSMADFVPCDRYLQKAYCYVFPFTSLFFLEREVKGTLSHSTSFFFFFFIRVYLVSTRTLTKFWQLGGGEGTTGQVGGVMEVVCRGRQMEQTCLSSFF